MQQSEHFFAISNRQIEVCRQGQLAPHFPSTYVLLRGHHFLHPSPHTPVSDVLSGFPCSKTSMKNDRTENVFGEIVLHFKLKFNLFVLNAKICHEHIALSL